MKMPRVIAEIGCNHKGDIEVAREMIGIAATFAKCDFVKFQKRSNKELLTPEEYNAVHPNLQNSYGESYGAHREFLNSTWTSIGTCKSGAGILESATLHPFGI